MQHWVSMKLSGCALSKLRVLTCKQKPSLSVCECIMPISNITDSEGCNGNICIFLSYLTLVNWHSLVPSLPTIHHFSFFPLVSQTHFTNWLLTSFCGFLISCFVTVPTSLQCSLFHCSSFLFSIIPPPTLSNPASPVLYMLNIRVHKHVCLRSF